ncbi:MAG: calcium-binding protein, partial [Leptolyngbya sp. SIO1D8]|nr:calcium-binding protein [Leptolyngbya sp. SIO1D8]
GGTGGDTMYGGSGHDTYMVDSGSDEVIENSHQGTDTVQSLIADYTLGSYVENLILYNASAVNGTGNSLDNNLYGNSNNNTLSGEYGSDILFGAAGNDTLDGGLSDDTMYGGTGNDWYIVHDNGDDVIEYENQGEADTVSSYVTSYWLGSHVENLILAASWAVNGYGNELDNLILGNGNDNHLLFGAEGDDLIYGQGDDDRLDGGSGNDTLLGGSGDDTLTGGGYDNITGDIDDLTGDGGGDLFVLGNDQEMFYEGVGFAKIRDYDESEGDRIWLHGSLDEYTLYKGGNYYGDTANDTVIHKDGDWIGVLVDTTDFSLSLGGWT